MGFCVPSDKWKTFAIRERQVPGHVSVMVWAAFSGERQSQLVIMDKDSDAKIRGITGRIYLKMLKEELPTMLDVDSIFSCKIMLQIHPDKRG